MALDTHNALGYILSPSAHSLLPLLCVRTVIGDACVDDSDESHGSLQVREILSRLPLIAAQQLKQSV